MLSFRDSAQTVDDIFLFIVAVSVALLAGVVVTMVYFVVRYSRERNPEPQNIEGNLWLEITWVVIPLVLVLAMFFYGWKGFRFMRTVPPNALPVRAIGSMWQWSFEYENGRTAEVLVVPSGRPVKLLITSRDVLHSLFIPAFRVKEDAVPGLQTYLWFLPDRIGVYDLFCSEYCGEGHSSMITKVKVISAEDFRNWYARDAKGMDGKDGIALLQKKGCLACHSTDGTKKIGPTFKGLMGSRIIIMAAGKEQEITVDEAYLKKSIMEPQAEIVKGFPPIMPQEKDNVTPAELEEIVNYIRGLK